MKWEQKFSSHFIFLKISTTSAEIWVHLGKYACIRYAMIIAKCFTNDPAAQEHCDIF